MKLRTFFFTLLIITTALTSYFIGKRSYQQEANRRAEEMIINDELPQDKVAISALDWILNERTNHELEKELIEKKAIPAPAYPFE